MLFDFVFGCHMKVFCVIIYCCISAYIMLYHFAVLFLQYNILYAAVVYNIALHDII